MDKINSQKKVAIASKFEMMATKKNMNTYKLTKSQASWKSKAKKEAKISAQSVKPTKRLYKGLPKRGFFLKTEFWHLNLT